ncbi:unnamed protein product [Meloidogyne enterolobii]|uniref:Uncharacterized protein n=1 Tax=Meloidogyne enterolobii TaxID=390850 RepID=A0ACB0ZFM7_MELEN
MMHTCFNQNKEFLRMDPNGSENGRFCLGALSNVHRSESSEKARLHIGKGIRLQIVDSSEDCNIFVECCSQKGIFVKSCFLDFQNGLGYGSAVHKFCFGAVRKVFNLKWAYTEMVEKKRRANMAAMVKAYAVAGIAPQNGLVQDSGTGVDDLRAVYIFKLWIIQIRIGFRHETMDGYG